MPEVFVLDLLNADAIAALASRVSVIKLPQSREVSWIGRATAIIVRTTPVTGAEIAAAAPTLKVIGKQGVGVDTIDLDAARQHGVRVVSTPGANAVSVCEMVLGLALALARRVPLADRALRAGTAFTDAERIGTELTGKTFGIIGFGDIGRRVATMMRAAFGATVAAYDPVVTADAFTANGAVRATSLAELLACADVVTIHAPLVPATRNLLGAAEFKVMKPSALLINAARGGIVDEDALADALRTGRIAAAASDVFVKEPPPASHPLLALPNFIGTPHIAGTTAEAQMRIGRDVVAGVLDVLEGRQPRFPVV